MKYFLAGLLLMAAAPSFAGTMRINAREVSCKDLKATVENYREVIVVSKVLFGKIQTYVYSDRPDCLPFQVPTRAFFRTNDKRNCQAGLTCETVRDPRFPEQPPIPPIPLPPRL